MLIETSRDLFFFLGQNFSSSTNTPYVPAHANSSSPSPSVISSLTDYDVYGQLDFEPRRDLVNGTAPVGSSSWHTDSNALGAPGKPYFVANGYGPKYLSSQYGYQVVQPLVTPKQAQDTNYTLSTLTLSRQTKKTPPTWSLEGAAAFEVSISLLMKRIVFLTWCTIGSRGIALHQDWRLPIGTIEHRRCRFRSGWSAIHLL